MFDIVINDKTMIGIATDCEWTSFDSVWHGNTIGEYLSEKGITGDGVKVTESSDNGEYPVSIHFVDGRDFDSFIERDNA